MSIVENNTDLSDYDQELIYHREESSYHLDQHVKSMIEAESHWKKHEEHEEIYKKLWRSKNLEVIYA
jgi:hypothetical protein